jgi:hypothetical protein
MHCGNDHQRMIDGNAHLVQIGVTPWGVANNSF